MIPLIIGAVENFEEVFFLGDELFLNFRRVDSISWVDLVLFDP